MIGRGIPNKYKLFLRAFPFLVLTFIFSYLPLSGWLYAFYDYMPGIPLSKTPFVGFKWFHSMVSNPTQTAEVLRVMGNTVAMSLLAIITSFLPAVLCILFKKEIGETLIRYLHTFRLNKAKEIITNQAVRQANFETCSSSSDGGLKMTLS